MGKVRLFGKAVKKFFERVQISDFLPRITRMNADVLLSPVRNLRLKET